MAEVLYGLNEVGEKIFMPMRELDSAHQKEVYEAAGDAIFTGLSLLGEAFHGGGNCYLVRLDDGRRISFPFVFAVIDEMN